MICSETQSFDQPRQGRETAQFNFLQKLRDTVAKMEISSELSISHPDYEPIEIPASYQSHLQQIPSSDRDRYLTAKLQNYLYDIYSGLIKPKQNSELDEVNSPEQMANYVNKWSETQFYEQLTRHNHGRGYSDPNWLVIQQQAENRWQIIKNGLILQIKPEKHLVDPSQPLQIGQLVSIKMPPNLVDHGLYIAVGDAGSINSSDSPQDFTVVQLYFNVNPEGVLLLLDSFTKQLNTLKIPFDFKIAYDEADFPRLDGAVLEFKSADFARLRPLLKKLYQETQAHFQPEIPFFCKQLELGLGLAEKPQAPDSEPENIGQHHCGIIAKALLEAWQQGNQSSTDKLNYVLNGLSKEGVDLKYLYLNPDSKDIYDL